MKAKICKIGLQDPPMGAFPFDAIVVKSKNLVLGKDCVYSLDKFQSEEWYIEEKRQVEIPDKKVGIAKSYLIEKEKYENRVHSTVFDLLQE